MNKIILCFTLFSLLLLSPLLSASTISAVKVPTGITYDIIEENVLSANPKVCIYGFEDETVTQTHYENIRKGVKQGVDDWESQLKNQERYPAERDKWDIETIIVPHDDLATFDGSDCNVEFYFEDIYDADQNDDGSLFDILGHATDDGEPVHIVLYWSPIEYVHSSDANFSYIDPVYTDGARSAGQMENVARHEFGHALGLGHYQYDDESANLALSELGDRSPSIMAPISPSISSELPIRLIDIELVKEIYGEDGFLGNQILEPEKKKEVTPEVESTPIPQTQQAEIPSWIKNNAAWWADGTIDDAAFLQGISFLIKEGIMTIPPTESTSTSDSKEVPGWVKNNAAWWADGTIDDNTFVTGVQFLVKNGIIAAE